MDQNYSINDILLAVDEINNLKKEKKEINKNKNFLQKDYSAVPSSTLKLIEEAEKTK